MNSYKEYFSLPLAEIKETVNSIGLDVQWTLAGRAAEYEESLKIAKQLEDGTLSKDDYLKRW